MTAADTTSREPGTHRRWRGVVGMVKAGLYPVLATLVIAGVWEAASRARMIPAFVLPAPSAVVVQFVVGWSLLARHGMTTLWEVLLAFAASIVFGVPVAVLITYFKPFERVMYPLLVAAQTVPKVALAPVFVIWFGFGLEPKVVVAFLIAFFPIVISTAIGLRSVQPEMLYLVQSMGATPWQAFAKIRLPNALPSVFGGLKVSITLAVVGAVVGEFVAGDQGLGYLIQLANGNLNTRLLFASILALSLIGIALFAAIDVVEKRMLRWHVSSRLEKLRATM